MAVTAAFLADFSSFRRETDRAETQLRSFETGAAKVQTSLNRLGNAFSGRRILQEATLAEKAIKDIGGVTKLTEAEQRKLNATVTEALAKYRALGIAAPKSLVDLEKATRQSTMSMEKFGTAIGTAVGVFAGQAAFLASRTLVQWGKDAVTSAGQIDDLSKKTGESYESLQRMRFVAEQTGASFEGMANAAYMLRGRLAGGSDSVLDALKELRTESGDAGLTVSSSADQILAALSKVEDAAKQRALGDALFGRSFRETAAAVVEGYDGLAEGAKLSSDAQIAALAAAGDAWDAFVRNSKTTVQGWMADMVIMAQDTATAFQQGGASMLMDMRAMGIPMRGSDINLSAPPTPDPPSKGDGKAAQTAADRLATQKRAWLNTLEEMRFAEIAAANQVQAVQLANAEQLKAKRLELLEIGMRLRDTTVQEASAAQDLLETTADIADVRRMLGERGMIMSPQTVEQGTGQVTSRWGQMVDDLKGTWSTLETAISGSFAQMILRATSFKDAMSNIFRSLVGAILNSFAQMVVGWVKSLFQMQAAGGGGGGGGNASSLVGGTAAGKFGLGGFGFGGGGALAALASNPLTWAAAGGAVLGWAIKSRGLFRGGEEALHVNPRRDQFTAQFGGPHGLAARLTEITGQAGGGMLYDRLRRASSVYDFERAQTDIIRTFAQKGQRNIRAFHSGGVVGGSGEQLALVQSGEGFLTRDAVNRLGGAAGVDALNRGGGGTIVNITMPVTAWDAQDVRRARPKILAELKDALTLNAEGFTTHLERVLA